MATRYEKQDKLSFALITNQQLTCANCVYRLNDEKNPSNTSKCKIFENCKPDKVLTGGECGEKKVEE